MKNNMLDVQTDTGIDIKHLVLSGKKETELRSIAQYHIWKLETRCQANQYYIFNKDRHTYSKTPQVHQNVCWCQAVNESGG